MPDYFVFAKSLIVVIEEAGSVCGDAVWSFVSEVVCAVFMFEHGVSRMLCVLLVLAASNLSSCFSCLQTTCASRHGFPVVVQKFASVCFSDSCGRGHYVVSVCPSHGNIHSDPRMNEHGHVTSETCCLP